MTRARWLVLGAVVMLGVGLSHAAAQETNGTPSEIQFWSGRVVEVSNGSVMVRRSLPGREPEVRKFLRTASTKVDGDVALDARVTVGYVQVAESNIARRILVRRPPK